MHGIFYPKSPNLVAFKKLLDLASVLPHFPPAIKSLPMLAPIRKFLACASINCSKLSKMILMLKIDYVDKMN